MSGARVAIVGGGVSGLATAYYLGQRGIHSILIERSNRLGGLIKTDLLEGCCLEAGPDSYISTKPAVTQLTEELPALNGQIISSNDAARRIFIVRSGRLVPLPRGMTMMVPGRLLPALRSDLFSPATKLRFLTERFSRPRERVADVTVGELVADHFGEEVLEYVADPLLSGVYGGNARDLSAESVLPRFIGFEKRFGSLIQGVRQEMNGSPKTGLFLSLRDGMQSLTDALTGAIENSTRIVHGEATAVWRHNTGWQIELAGERCSVEQLVLACPAHSCARLLEASAPELTSQLAAIPYSSAILVTLLYRAADIDHPLDGFGFLVPPRERRTVAAATWINRKFPTRIATGWIAIRAFIVAEQAVQLERAQDSELAELVQQDLATLLGIIAKAQRSLTNRWPHSMPQYVVGHRARQQTIAQLLKDQPALHLVGNAYDGVGIPDCVRLARATAQEISAD